MERSQSFVTTGDGAGAEERSADEKGMEVEDGDDGADPGVSADTDMGRDEDEQEQSDNGGQDSEDGEENGGEETGPHPQVSGTCCVYFVPATLTPITQPHTHHPASHPSPTLTPITPHTHHPASHPSPIP